MGTGGATRQNPLSGGPENRRYPRIPGQIPVVLKRIAAASREAAVMDVAGQNISRGGICISAGHPYAERTMVRLEIRLMGWSKYTTPSALAGESPADNTFKALGQVVWCRPAPGGRKHEVGIRFVDIDERAYRALMAYLKDLEAMNPA